MLSELVLESRRNRAFKLLKKLKLKYPSDLELRELASLAKVDEPSIFGRHILAIILDAHLNNASLRTLKIPKVRKKLQSVEKKAQHLRNTLKDIDVGTQGSAEYAGMLLEYEIAGFQFNGEMVLIPEYVQLLDALENAASRAAKLPKSKKGPKWGAFDGFIEALLMAARQRRGAWTNSNLAGNWSGSLLKAISILQPYLPNEFFPGGERGRSVERVRNNFKKYITEKQTPPV